MHYALFAAAGIAEAAWALVMILMWGGLFVICIVGFSALIMASRTLAITAMVLLVAFTVFFQPWYCFIPFEPDSYKDPDVASAADEFRAVGFGWVATTVFVPVISLIAWFIHQQQGPVDDSDPASQSPDG